MLRIRNSFLGIFLLLGFMGLLPVQSQMIATIDHPVASEFGEYVPNLVRITPNAETYQVAPDLSNVVNIQHFNFSAEEKRFLTSNHFFVTPKRTGDHTGYKEIYDVYNECREQGIPIFVTTDAVLHTFHLLFDQMLMEVEQQQFFGDLNNLLSGLLDIVIYDQYPKVTDAETRQAVLKTLDFLIVAKVLLDSTYVPPINGGKYLEELANICKHDSTLISPLFGYEEDYTQYKVRGHYTRSDTLKHYFQSMMWLGRMTFAADPSGKFDNLNREATLAALILIQAMQQLTIQAESSLTVWDRIYAPTVFFVGKSDDINFLQYLQIVEAIYGTEFSTLDINQIGQAPHFDNFLEQAKRLPGPKIRYPGQPQGFRFMGQRFIPDSYVLDQLVFDNVPGRFMPKGLDVMAVLGSAQAYQQLEALGEMSNTAYKIRLDELCTEFKNYPPETWAQNLYWNWLYSLMPLLFEKTTGYPPFMQNPAWTDKELYAALGSWAELRHDTILYAKQSGTERGMPESNILKQGFVEPNPHFYARVAALARFLITGLANRNLLHPKFDLHLTTLEKLALDLKNISEKELMNKPLSQEDYLLIHEFGLTIEGIAAFKAWADPAGPSPISEDEMPVIADVHTDFNSGTCLEEAVGYPFSIYVICNIEGELKVTRGAGFSYYEFVQPMSNRLTDEEWREILKKDPVPPVPTWTASFLNADWKNPNPEYYFLDKMGTASLKVKLSTDSTVVGNNIEILISAYLNNLLSEPTVIIENSAGEQWPLTDLTPQAESYQGIISTTGLTAGRYYVMVTGVVADWENEIELTYRTSFKLTATTAIGTDLSRTQPSQFGLKQNFPNPFNAGTVIQYQLINNSPVNLTIFDTLGREIINLVKAQQPAGHYQIHWNGLDRHGNVVPAGVYVAELRAGEFREMRKMILLY